MRTYLGISCAILINQLFGKAEGHFYYNYPNMYIKNVSFLSFTVFSHIFYIHVYTLIFDQINKNNS